MTFNEESKRSNGTPVASEFLTQLAFQGLEEEEEPKEVVEIFHEIEEDVHEDVPTADNERDRSDKDVDVAQMQLRNRREIKKPKRYDVNVAECEELHLMMKPCHQQTQVTGRKPSKRNYRPMKPMAHGQAEDQLKAIDSRWVFKIKRDSAGNIQRYKARLCARDFFQPKSRLPGDIFTGCEIRFHKSAFSNCCM